MKEDTANTRYYKQDEGTTAKEGLLSLYI